MDYQVDNFDEFVKKNWSELVEYAEEQTGESYYDPCGEPLLTKDGVIEEAQVLWEEYLSDHEEDSYMDYINQEVNALNAK